MLSEYPQKFCAKVGDNVILEIAMKQSTHRIPKILIVLVNRKRRIHANNIESGTPVPSASSSFFHYVSRPLVPALSPSLSFSPPTQNCFFGGRNSEARTRITGTPTNRARHMVGYDTHARIISIHVHFARSIRYIRTNVACTHGATKPGKMKDISRKPQRMTEHALDTPRTAVWSRRSFGERYFTPEKIVAYKINKGEKNRIPEIHT